MSSTLDPARRAALMGGKLASLVADAGHLATRGPEPLGAGAALVDDAGRAWVLLDAPPGQGLGGALAWALRHQATALHLLATSGTGVLARRCQQLTLPVTVLHLEGRSQVLAIAEPLPPAASATPAHRALIQLIAAGGADPVEEHAVVSGEVRGLEVCRVVDDATIGTVRLDVGIGVHDREMFQMLHGDRPTVESLSEVVRTVDQHRRGASHHPLRNLAASRLLRHRLIAEPGLIGLDSLVAVEPPVARTNLKDEVPCVAFDRTTATVVVCVSGVDLEAVPFACDAIVQHGAGSCLVAAPDRDVLPIQQRLAGLLTVPTRFVPVALAMAS